MTRKKLGAGVNLTCVTTPKFKRAVLRAALLLPLGGPDAALRACLPQVLRRGTARLPDLGAIGAALDDAYGARIETTVRKEGETLAVGFLSDCIDEQYAPGAEGLTASVVRLLCEMLFAPYLMDGVFSPDYTEGEKKNLLDRIAAQKNDPRQYAPKRLTELMCENEAYGQSALGTAGQAERITENKLYTAYRRALDEAQLELFYCGTMAPDAVEALFAAALPARGEGAFYTPAAEIVPRPAGAPREIVEREPVTQGKLSLGFRTGGTSLLSGDTPAYWMFQTIFGGSTSSKLFLNVREKKSLCYYASAQFVGLKGILLVNSGIENKDFEVARDEITRQLEACRAGDISDAEIESARKTLTSAWRTMLDDPLTLERYWLTQAVAGTLTPPEERVGQIESVTRERIVAAAEGTALDTVYFMKGAGK
ncbi:MAG: insulinase family protein [Eubacteriales bacterium]|nr:insulinase family protein [Eubacteriales bacterium]